MNLNHRITKQRELDLAINPEHNRGQLQIDSLKQQVRELACLYAQTGTPVIDVEILEKTRRPIFSTDVDIVLFSEYSGKTPISSPEDYKSGYVRIAQMTRGWILDSVLIHRVYSHGEPTEYPIDMALTLDGRLWWHPVPAYGAPNTFGVLGSSVLNRELEVRECDTLIERLS